MNCPLCKIKLDKALLTEVEIDYCSKCYGLWFEEEELRFAKDAKDRDLRWLDIDLWKDPAKFKLNTSTKLCPKDRLPLYETSYGDSGIKVDVCNLCYGIWLDRGEFKSIISFLKHKMDSEVLFHYLANLKEELWELFSGPEILKEELLDALAVLKLVRYKLLAQHPILSKIIAALQK